jgi:hypothetical protein
LENTSSKNLRKQFLIEPVLQKRIIWNFFLLGLMMTVVNIAGFFFLMNQIVGYTEGAEQVSPAMAEFLQATWNHVTVTMVVVSTIMVAGFGFYGLYFSNRIAGPIYQIRKCIGRILAGEKDVRVIFRKGDYFPELSDEMNALINERLQ